MMFIILGVAIGLVAWVAWVVWPDTDDPVDTYEREVVDTSWDPAWRDRR